MVAFAQDAMNAWLILMRGCRWRSSSADKLEKLESVCFFRYISTVHGEERISINSKLSELGGSAYDIATKRSFEKKMANVLRWAKAAYAMLQCMKVMHVISPKRVDRYEPKSDMRFLIHSARLSVVILLRAVSFPGL